MVDWSAIPPLERPKYRSIEKVIQQLILAAELAKGERLPAERTLAHDFKVNRSTITTALDELVATGWLVRKPGSGTFVSETSQQDRKRVNWHAFLNPLRFGKDSPERVAIKQLLQARPVDLIDVYSSELPLEWVPQFQFPQLTWQTFLQAATLEQVGGFRPLIDTISRLQQTNHGPGFQTNEILITAGAQQALFIILQGLLAPGDAVAIERPSLFQNSSLFQATGIRTFDVALTQQGLDLVQLERQIVRHRVKIVLLNPNYQNPTGQVMSLAQRQAVIALCQRYQVPIVEDDAFGWLGFKQQGDGLPTLKALAPQNVIYINSLSKVLGANTRIGWVVATPSVIAQLAIVQRELDITLGIMPQMMTQLMLENADFQVQIEQLQRTLEQQAQALCYQLQLALPDWQITRPQGGYYLWLQRPNQLAQPANLARLLAHDIAVAPGKLFGSRVESYRINVAKLTQANLTLFVQRFVASVNGQS